MRRLLAACSALLLLVSCGGTFFAEIEIPEVKVTLVDQPFDGVTTPGVDLVKDITYDLGKDISVLNDPDVTYDLRLTSLELALTGTSGLADFSGIDEVTVQVLPPAGSSLLPVTVVSYVKPTSGPPPTIIRAGGRANIDLAPYIQAGSLTLRATAKGSLPGTAWNANVTGGFYLKLRYDYGKKLGL
jgi:hypothetical protein